jgi:hypothetical protein
MSIAAYRAEEGSRTAFIGKRYGRYQAKCDFSFRYKFCKFLSVVLSVIIVFSLFYIFNTYAFSRINLYSFICN